MKKLIKLVVPNPILERVREWRAPYGTMSYSQEGEDVVLDRFLHRKKCGFYIDVGALHPKRFSNTYMFYRRGWSGISIDANPGSMKVFRKVRPRDINIEAAVSLTPRLLTYYAFNEPALNTFGKELAKERVDLGFAVLHEVEIQTNTLAQLLDRYLPPGTKIDFLTVDVEGLDYEVLRSNDWSRYSPDYVLVESLNTRTMEEASLDPITGLLRDNHYVIVAKTMNTMIFNLKTIGTDQ